MKTDYFNLSSPPPQLLEPLTSIISNHFQPLVCSTPNYYYTEQFPTSPYYCQPPVYSVLENISSVHRNPKISANLKTLTTVNKHKSPETMHTEARIASTEPRNICLTLFYAYRT